MKPVPLVISAVGIVLIAAFVWSRTHSGTGVSPIQYKLGAASRATVRKTFTASGTLQPWTTVDVKSKAGGRIDLLAVDVGTVVKPGQIIAKIDPTDSLLTYNQAKADTESASAKQRQTHETFLLQVAQSATGVEQAQANLDSAKANLRQVAARLQTAATQNVAQPALTNAAIGQARAAYDAAVQSRSKLEATQAQDRASAQSAYDQAVANDRNAQVNLTRQESLLAKGFVSQSTVDQARANAGVTKAQVDSAKSKLDTLSAQQKAEREASDASVAQAKATLNTAQTQSFAIATSRNTLSEQRAALRQAQAQVEQYQAAYDQAIANRRNNAIKQLDIEAAQASTNRAEASLSNAKTTLDQTTVRAPSEGVVLQKYVEQGTIITSGLSLNSSGTSIVQLGDITRMYVDVAVDETDVASVSMGQPVDIAFDAFPGRAFHGKVTKINPQAVVESNVTTIHVRVEVNNRSEGFGRLKPNMNATCEFIVGEAKDVLTVPADAVHREDGGPYVEIASGGKPAAKAPADPNTLVGVKIERRKVETGLEGNEATEIKSGLHEGDVVVVQTIVPDVAQPQTQGAAAFGGGGPRMGGMRR